MSKNCPLLREKRKEKSSPYFNFLKIVNKSLETLFKDINSKYL